MLFTASSLHCHSTAATRCQRVLAGESPGRCCRPILRRSRRGMRRPQPQPQLHAGAVRRSRCVGHSSCEAPPCSRQPLSCRSQSLQAAMQGLQVPPESLYAMPAAGPQRQRSSPLPGSRWPPTRGSRCRRALLRLQPRPLWQHLQADSQHRRTQVHLCSRLTAPQAAWLQRLCSAMPDSISRQLSLLVSGQQGSQMQRLLAQERLSSLRLLAGRQQLQELCAMRL